VTWHDAEQGSVKQTRGRGKTSPGQKEKILIVRGDSTVGVESRNGALMKVEGKKNVGGKGEIVGNRIL